MSGCLVRNGSEFYNFWKEYMPEGSYVYYIYKQKTQKNNKNFFVDNFEWEYAHEILLDCKEKKNYLSQTILLLLSQHNGILTKIYNLMFDENFERNDYLVCASYEEIKTEILKNGGVDIVIRNNNFSNYLDLVKMIEEEKKKEINDLSQKNEFLANEQILINNYKSEFFKSLFEDKKFKETLTKIIVNVLNKVGVNGGKDER